jgi:predicted nucleotidyltransferase
VKEIVAIICEYNPFHNGHEYQVDKIKEMFPDSVVVSIMSGNFTQRGEFALFDKYTRAKAAVTCGVDCVVELPYPFCASNAEIFAKAGVYIASKLGVTHLCFGVEGGNIKDLTEIADTIDSEEFTKKFEELKQDKSISYPKLREIVCRELGEELPNSSNMILGVEYIRAIKKYGNSIIPVAIKREGLGYNDLSVGKNMSATAIRAYFVNNNSFVSVPNKIDKLYSECIDNGSYVSEKDVKDFMFRSVVTMDPLYIENLYDAPSGAGYFIIETANNSKNSEEFFGKLTTKTYTYARLRRIVLYSLFAVDKIDDHPSYTSVLALNEKGRELLKILKKQTDFPIITKLADYTKMDKSVIEQFEVSAKADRLFTSFLKNSSVPSDFIRKNPYIT